MPVTTNFDLQAEVDLILNSIRDGLLSHPQTSHDTMLFILLCKAGAVERHAVVLKCHDRADLLQRMIHKVAKQFGQRHHGQEMLGVALVAEARMTDPTDATRETGVIMVEALSGTLTPALSVLSTTHDEFGHLAPGGRYKATQPPMPDHLRAFIDTYRQCQAKSVAKWN